MAQKVKKRPAGSRSGSWVSGQSGYALVKEELVSLKRKHTKEIRQERRKAEEQMQERRKAEEQIKQLRNLLSRETQEKEAEKKRRQEVEQKFQFWQNRQRAIIQETLRQHGVVEP